MKKMFAAYLLILIDLNVTIGSRAFNLLPALLGYLLLVPALDELAGENERFGTLCPVALAMAIFSAVITVLQRLGRMEAPPLRAGCAAVGMGMLLLFTWQLLRAFREVEEDTGLELYSRPQRVALGLLAGVAVLVGVSVFVPQLAVASSAAGVAVSLLFLAGLYRTQRAFAGLGEVC